MFRAQPVSATTKATQAAKSKSLNATIRVPSRVMSDEARRRKRLVTASSLIGPRARGHVTAIVRLAAWSLPSGAVRNRPRRHTRRRGLLGHPERRKKHDSEHDHEPDQLHGHLAEMAGGESSRPELLAVGRLNVR